MLLRLGGVCVAVVVQDRRDLPRSRNQLIVNLCHDSLSSPAALRVGAKRGGGFFSAPPTFSVDAGSHRTRLPMGHVLRQDFAYRRWHLSIRLTSLRDFAPAPERGSNQKIRTSDREQTRPAIGAQMFS